MGFIFSPHFVNNITRAMLLQLVWLTIYALNYITFRGERVALHNSELYLQVREFCTKFLKLKRFRPGKNRELQQIADRKIYLV
jgi:hypothetical protein